jgi:DNA-directed RNA polymerase II subunit RPB1
MSVKRLLTTVEIEDLCSVVEPSVISPSVEAHRSRSAFESDMVYVENIKENLRKQLSKVLVYPEIIDQLKSHIRHQYYKSVIQPGEMVGGVAAGSMGQVNTQDSLNSFHSSGQLKANLTTGLSRLNELMNLTERLKTPSLTIYFKADYSEDLYTVRSIVESRLIYRTIESSIISYAIEEKSSIKEWESFYAFHSMFYSQSYDACDIRLRLRFNPKALYLSKKSLQHVAECIAGHIDTKCLHMVWSSDFIGILDIWVTTPTAGKSVLFIKHVLLNSALSVPFSGVRGLEECYYSEAVTEKGKIEWYVDTKGGEFKDLLKVEEIDFTRCKSNKVWDIYKLFGIEAAKAFLREEFQKNINVSFRHLDLLVECMTNSGTLTSVSRYGIDRTQVGPLAKASFEQPVENFLISATKAEKDDLKGVSASISCGKLGALGTGMMQLILDTSKFAQTPEAEDSKSLKEPFKENYDDEELL